MNFLDLGPEHSDAGRARAAVLPVAYEATTSYGGGTLLGPAAIIKASSQVEVYDEIRRCSPAEDFGIATLDEGAPAAIDPDLARLQMEEAIESAMVPGRVVCVLGGEHSITPVAVEAVASTMPDIVAVVLDAHADLRDSYDGSRNSHACASRRISEICPVLEIGVRSLSAECAAFLESSDRVKAVFAHDLAAGEVPFGAISDFCGGKPVYLSIDIDCLDPSEMPATGTPEPGGLSYRQVLAIIDEVARSASRIAGLDLVELAPIKGIHAPDFLAARLCYKAITAAVMGPAGG